MIKQVQYKQNIFDIALQHTGSLESAYDIASKNKLGSLNITEDFELKINSIVEPRLVSYFIDEQVTPATQPSLSSESFSNSFNASFS